MKIHNIRYGFATNSSSSHSIICNAPGMHDDEADGEFGWNYFTAASREAKIRYLAAHFNHWGDQDQQINDMKKTILGLTDEQVEEYRDDSVDHQSNLGFSKSYHVDDDFESFVTAIKDFILKDDVVILGGNDNDDYDLPIPDGGQVFEGLDRFTDMGYGNQMIVKKEGDYFTLFNSQTGFKVRTSFADAPRWEKSHSPELVDLKITQKCNFGCEFCYQGSTKDGQHAPLDRIKHIIDVLAASKVFEIAIGGGEPTEHPEFAEILRYCRSKNIIPNFTTFTTAWINNDEIMDAVKEYCGGVGISIHDAKQLNKVGKIKEAFKTKYGYGGPMFMAQHVVGSAPVSDLYQIIERCLADNVQLLLLGFKTTGFGAKGPDYDVTPDELVTLIQLMKDDNLVSKRYWYNHERARPHIPPTLSIDTQMIDLYRNALEQCSINPDFLSSPEGKFSCYWDAVDDKIAKSSYCGPTEFVDAPNCSIEEFLEIYSRF